MTRVETTPSAAEPDLEAVFKRYDSDGSGTIDIKELAVMLKELGIDAQASGEATTAMIEAFDADNSGGLEIGEFRKLVAEIRAAHEQRKEGAKMPAWLKSLSNPGDLITGMGKGFSNMSTSMGKGLEQAGTSVHKSFEQAGKSMGRGLEESGKGVAAAWDKLATGTKEAAVAIGRVGADEIEQVFRKFDADGSGTIDGGELSAMLKEMGIDTDADAATKVINAFDADESGGLEIGEFRKLVAEIRAAHEEGKKGGSDMPPWLQAITNPVANAGDLVKQVSSDMAEAVASPVKDMVRVLTPKVPEQTEEEASKAAEEAAIQRAHAAELKQSPERKREEALEEERRAAGAAAERVAAQKAADDAKRVAEEKAVKAAMEAKKAAEEAKMAAEAAKRVAAEKAMKAAEDRAKAEAARKAAEAEVQEAAEAAKQAMEEAVAAEQQADAHAVDGVPERSSVSGMAEVQRATGSAAFCMGLFFALCGMVLASLTPAERSNAVKGVINGVVDAYTKRFA